MLLDHLLEKDKRSEGLKKILIFFSTRTKNYGHPLSNVHCYVGLASIFLNLFISREFYGLNDAMDPKLLLTRCKEGKKKNIYYTSPLVRDLTRTNVDRLTV